MSTQIIATKYWFGSPNGVARQDMAMVISAFFPTAQATNNHRCSGRLFKTFASHRPEAAKVPESPFFLAINQKRRAGSQIWYTKCALGKNSIWKFLFNAAKAAGLPGNVSNQSVLKTCISRLMDADVPSNYVAQLSGHKLESEERQEPRCL